MSKQVAAVVRQKKAKKKTQQKKQKPFWQTGTYSRLNSRVGSFLLWLACSEKKKETEGLKERHYETEKKTQWAESVMI